MKRIARLALATLIALAFAPNAYASWVGKWSDHLYYNAENGEQNTVRVTLQPNGDIRFTDGGANPIRAENVCSLAAGSVADCPSAGVTHIKIRLEDRDDLAIVDVGLRALVWGHDGNDDLFGGAGNDELYGGWGVDELAGRGGADLMDGGANLGDTASYPSHPSNVFVQLDDGSSASAGAIGENDVLRGIRNLEGGPGNDVLFGDGRINTIRGGSGDDTLGGGPLGDVLEGGLGDDRLIDGFMLGGGSDELRGGSGVDLVDYSAGAQRGFVAFRQCGAPWDGCGPDPDPYAAPPTSPPSTLDSIRVTLDDVANDGAFGPPDPNRIDASDNVASDVENVLGSPMDDVLSGSGGRNVIWGGDGSDTLEGLAGDDWLYGGDGNDVTNGGDGTDVLTGDAGGDLLAGAAGFDTVDYSDRTAAVLVAVDDSPGDGEPGENDNVMSDVERIVGSPFDDNLYGAAGAQTLSGGAGKDTIVGGAGPDRLEGGAGDDLIAADDRERDSVDCGPDTDQARIDMFDPPVANCEQVNDVAPPVVTCDSGPSGWIRGPVTVQCSAIDWESGPADPQSFSLTASLPDGEERADAPTNSVTVCDQALNCVVVSRTFKIDRKGPTFVGGVLPDDRRFILNEQVTVRARCEDYGVDTGFDFSSESLGRYCRPAGLVLATRSVGTHNLGFEARDRLMNISRITRRFHIGYALCNGSTNVRPPVADVFVSLCDANGVNVSDPQIVLTNAAVDGLEPEKEPLSFQYEEAKQAGYRIEIPTVGLPTGPHRLTFTAGLDPEVHSIEFEVP